MEPIAGIRDFLHFKSQVDQAYDVFFNQVIAVTDLSRQEADILIFLANNPQYKTARDIVRYRKISKSYVSKAVEKLLAKGLITVEVKQCDRRYQYLELSAQAQSDVAILQAGQQEFTAKMTAGFSQEEIDAFLKVIQRFAANLADIK